MSIARFSDFSEQDPIDSGNFLVGHEHTGFRGEKKFAIGEIFSLYSSTDMEISGKRTFHDLNINNISGIDDKVNELFKHTPINFSGEIGGISTPRAWINEIHYDNKCEDMHEFVEICGHTGLVPKRFSVVHYNSSGYMVKKNEYCKGEGCGDETPMIFSLTGDSFSNVHKNFGFEILPMNGISNEEDFGFALVYDYEGPAEQVLQLISYEGSGYQGSFVGKEGPASGMRSHEIWVEQDPDEMGITCQNLRTLQLFGTGNRYSDFEWRFPTTTQLETSGYLNHDQDFLKVHNESGRKKLESRLGINTSDPLDTLHVKGGATVEGNLLIFGPDSGHYGHHRKTIVRVENLPGTGDVNEIPPNSIYRSGDFLMIKPTTNYT